MLNFLTKTKIIPVIILDNAEYAVPLAKAIVAGGISVLEVTLRTPSSLNTIENIVKHVPEAIVGAGTIIDKQQFMQAKNAGAKFAVSPGLSAQLVEAARSAGMPYLPGVSTASEVLLAHQLQLSALKFFPAEICGGKQWLSSIYNVFPKIKFCPTGGVTPLNMLDYIAQQNVCCVGGTWLTPKKLVEAQSWSKITALVQQSLSLLQPVEKK